MPNAEVAMTFQFPNETPQYRAARNRLLESEVELRRKMEAVAAELRALPLGGHVPEDYVFERIGPDGKPETVTLSQLFGRSDTVMIYQMMFPRHSGDSRKAPSRGPFATVPLVDGPCPSCTALIDMWEGTMPHFEGLGGNLVVVAKASAAQLSAFAEDRGWKNIRLLSGAGNNFGAHYGGIGPDGEPVPIMTVFKRDADGTICLHWASELVFEPCDPGQDMRHLGTVEPLWTLFDLTPGGRPAAGEEFDYSCCSKTASE
jgi:predicted dithiol-disulfide oxidoreductase (DUF899 family)